MESEETTDDDNSCEIKDVECEFLILSRNGNVEKLKELIALNPKLDINCKGQTKCNRGWSALHLATYFGHINAVSYLLSLGVDPDVRNSAGDTPLHKAAFTSRENVVHKLLEYESNVFIYNDERKKAQDVACDENIKQILQAAEKVKLRKIFDQIFAASKERNVDIIVELLAAHPEIVNANIQDELGNTPLHYAAMRDNRSVAVYLLQHGADSSIANKEGQTALDLGRTSHLRQLLEVRPIQNSAMNVERFEGFLSRKRFLGPRLHYVVLDKGVMSYFARHADAITGYKRRLFKYLTDAVITVREESNHTFQIQFFDSSVHYLQVRQDGNAHINRQKWIQAIQLHIDYSSHYASVGRIQESDEEDEEKIPVVDIKNTVETALAHNELLKKQIDEFAVAVHKMAASDTSQTAFQLLGKCHQVLNISNEMTTAFSLCVSTIQRQDQIRKIQLDQEKENTRIWQQAFEALATEHHNLERTISIHSPETLSNMTSTSHPDPNGDVESLKANSLSSMSGGFLSDEEFYDAYGDSDEDNEFDSSPKQKDQIATTSSAQSKSSDASGKPSLNDNLNNISRMSDSSVNNENGNSGQHSASVHYKHRHSETHKNGQLNHTDIVEDVETLDEVFQTSHGVKTIHSEKKIHIEKVHKEKPNVSEEKRPSISSVSSTDSEGENKDFEDCIEHYHHRDRLPVTMFSRSEFSFWSILKQCIGKELSKITMPVIFNEPLSFVQRLCEYMEYTALLKKACQMKDSTQRLQYVAAFVISAQASQLDRVGKPYNPLLGETYECNRPDLGFSWISEQVSHHPPVSAFHVDGTDNSFTFHGSVHPKLKFWGKSVEVEPKGPMTIKLNDLNETYTWTNPNLSVHNVVVGKPWIEQHGLVEISCQGSQEKCVLNFKSHSWLSKGDLNKVEGFILDAKKNKIVYMEGDWTKHLYVLSPEAHEIYKQEMSPQSKSSSKKTTRTSSSEVLHSLMRRNDCFRIWKAQPRPSYTKEYYNFTSYAMTLNEIKEKELAKLPPTDTKHRTDIRCQENGDIEGAGNEKFRLEEKQRTARRLRSKLKEEWTPRWFDLNAKQEWVFNGKYRNRDWSKCPDIF